MQHTKMIRKAVGPFNLNTYFLVCKKTKKTLIIDPGGPAEDLVEFLCNGEMIPEKILLTHGHADHIFSMSDFSACFDIPYCLHEKDDDFFKRPEVREKTKQMVGLPPPHPADIRLQGKQTIKFGQASIKVVHTPGHTPGSACFLCENHLFTGDAIFVGEAGRVDLPGGNLDLLVTSIKKQILPMDPQTVIHPGHYHSGDPFESTIAKEMKTNIYITDFILTP